MGGRGAFIDVCNGDFHFVEGGKRYHSVGVVGNTKVLVQDKGASKAPEFSHTADRSYAVIQDGKLKHLAWYGKNHEQLESIDFLHSHNGVRPHKHIGLNHGKNTPGIPISQAEADLADKIRKEFHLKCE